MLEKVCSLTIRIFATFQSSACLANIQIWATPSYCVDKKVQKDIKSIWQALIHAKSVQNQDSLQQSIEEKDKKSSQKRRFSESFHDSDSTPQEFLDALTCKRMDVPMLLPSGQYVDRSSLDNYNQIEAKWGRSANDPFTGLAFTETKKAIFDDKLKSRIDTFVLGTRQSAIVRERIILLLFFDM